MNKTYNRERLKTINESKDKIKDKYKDEIEVKCLNDEILLYCKYYIDELKNYLEKRKETDPYMRHISDELTNSLISQLPMVKEKATKIIKELRNGEMLTATAPRHIAAGILAYTVKLYVDMKNPNLVYPKYLLTLHEIATRVTNTNEVSMRNNMKFIINYINQNKIEI